MGKGRREGARWERGEGEGGTRWGRGEGEGRARQGREEWEGGARWGRGEGEGGARWEGGEGEEIGSEEEKEGGGGCNARREGMKSEKVRTNVPTITGKGVEGSLLLINGLHIKPAQKGVHSVDQRGALD